MATFLDSRKTISLLNDEIPHCPYLDTLSETFDMYRRVSVSFLTMVTHYSYLEYLARPIITPEEVSKFLNKLRKRVSSQLLYITSARKSVCPVHILEDRVEEQHLDLLPPVGIKCILYKLKGTGFEIEEHTPNSMMYPVCYVLTHDDKYFILYTPVMSFLDGYDPYTGERKQHIIPDTFIQYARGVLVYHKLESEPGSPRGKRKIEVSTPKFSKVLGITLFRNSSGEERKTNESLERKSNESYEAQSTESRNSNLTHTSYRNEPVLDKYQSRHLSLEPTEQRDSDSMNYSSRGSIRSSRSSLHSRNEVGDSSISDPELESPHQCPRLSSPIKQGRLFQSMEFQGNYLKTLPEELEDSEERNLPSLHTTRQDDSSTQDWFYDNMFVVSAAPNNRFYPRSTRYEQSDWRTIHTSKQPIRENCTSCNIF